MALAALVVWLFLRDWRATAVTAVAMPVSLIPAFAFMALAGFSLDTVSLLALTLVIGILVDDAIVEIENIEKRVYVGMRPYAAAMEGADQIGLAVVATTAAIVVVFLPVSFMPGIPGQFFKEFGLTVSVAVLFSLVVARLLTPLLAAYFLKPKAAEAARAAAGDLRHVAAVGAGPPDPVGDRRRLVFFVSVLLAIAVVPKGLQPEGNPNYYQVDVDTPPGSTMDDTRRRVAGVGDLLARQPETAHVFTAVGGGGGGGGGRARSSASGVTSGVAVAVLKPHRSAKVPQIRDRLRPRLHAIPDARVTFAGPADSAARRCRCRSPATAATVSTAPRWSCSARWRPAHPGRPAAGHLAAGAGDDHPAHGPTTRRGSASAPTPSPRWPGSPPSATSTPTSPSWTSATAAFRSACACRTAARSDLPTLRNLRVPTASGGLTTLGSVADVYFQAGPAQITRYDRRDDIIVLADLANGAKLSDAYDEIEQAADHAAPAAGRDLRAELLATSRRRTSCSSGSASPSSPASAWSTG